MSKTTLRIGAAKLALARASTAADFASASTNIEDSAGIGVDRATRRRAHDLVLTVLAEHQHHLHRHSTWVAAMARAVGKRLGLGPVELSDVVHTAELHDVGKLALPDVLLHKAGPLDEAEWQLMRQHTLAGEQILDGIPAVAKVGRFVRSCHERWDGRGYPDGLAGEEIPLASRVVFACDAFDAMSTWRPYQRPKSPPQALSELERCAGGQFDRWVVYALVDELVSSEGLERRPDAVGAA